MHVIIGGRGRLGSCLAQAAGEPVHIIDRSIYSEWRHSNSKAAILQYFAERHITEATIFITAGILDPALPLSEHESINYELPKNIIESVNKPGWRVITFGTVLEKLIGDKTQNPYVISKLRLANFIKNHAADKASALHIRLHTLYGGMQPPHAFMFLGQLLNAMHSKSEFKMTSGEQLREYHHIEDAAKAIWYLSRSTLTGITQLSHGQPEKLKDIAQHVLNAFAQLSSLRLNALTSPTHENYDAFFEPGSYINEVTFRKALPGIVDYLKPFMAESPLESSIII